MGRGKSALRSEDYMVLNACRWKWWELYEQYMKQNMSSHVRHISMDKYVVRQVLTRAFQKSSEKVMDDDQVYYRLTKLADRGYLTRSYRGAYQLTGAAEPEAQRIIEDIERDSKDQQLRDEELVTRLKTMVDLLIPGHLLQVQASPYAGKRVMGYPWLVLSGPGHQLRMLFTWAENHVKALDAAVLEQQEDE